MKIGIYIAPFHTVPPEEKQIVAPWVLAGEIADGMVDLGHTTYLFAASGSRTKAILKDFGIASVVSQKNNMDAAEFLKFSMSQEQAMFSHVLDFAAEEKLEIVHMHQTKRIYSLLSQAPRSIHFVITIHNPIDAISTEEITELEKLGNCFIVSISDSQRKGSHLTFIGTVYNGITLADYSFSDGEKNRYLVTGRIVAEKGFDDALYAVQSTESQLLVTGQLYNEQEGSRRYWEKLNSYIDGRNIQYHESFTHSELIKAYQQSKALLFPIKWEEPFGMVMIEAMACGTPVVAYAHGSVPEVVEDGVSGYIVNFSDGDKRGDFVIQKTGREGLIEAIRRINNITDDQYQAMRRAARKRVEDKFSAEKMVAGYEAVYKKILK